MLEATTAVSPGVDFRIKRIDLYQRNGWVHYGFGIGVEPRVSNETAGEARIEGQYVVLELQGGVSC